MGVVFVIIPRGGEPWCAGCRAHRSYSSFWGCCGHRLARWAAQTAAYDPKRAIVGRLCCDAHSRSTYARTIGKHQELVFLWILGHFPLIVATVNCHKGSFLCFPRASPENP
jgi:hypothetical protein